MMGFAMITPIYDVRLQKSIFLLNRTACMNFKFESHGSSILKIYPNLFNLNCEISLFRQSTQLEDRQEKNIMIYINLI